jgi:hypothetical protein
MMGNSEYQTTMIPSTSNTMTEAQRQEVEKRTQQAMRDMQQLVESANATMQMSEATGEGTGCGTDSMSSSNSSSSDVHAMPSTYVSTSTSQSSKTTYGSIPAVTPTPPHPRLQSYGQKYKQDFEPLFETSMPMPPINTHKTCLTRMAELLGL